MKELDLKNSDLKALVDDEDHQRLSARHWTIQTRDGRPHIVSADTEQIPLRKFVLDRTEGYPAVVHRDGNYLNCQKANLKEVPRSEVSKTVVRKQSSRTTFRPGKSGRLGVTHYTLRDEWRVVVYYQGRTITIGYWKNLDFAARAYDHAVQILRGPDTPTNLSQGLIAPDAVPPDIDAKIRAEVERAIQNDQPRYPPSTKKK